MATLVAYWAPSGVPLASPANLPTIRIRRADTNALVVTDAAMAEAGDGSYTYDFTTVSTLEYTTRADGDPLGLTQVPASDRYQYGALSGITESLEVLVAAMPTSILEAIVSPSEAISGSVAQALAVMLNGLEVNIATQKLELYNDAHTALIRSWPLETNSGAPDLVTTAAGVQTKRLAADP